MRTRQGLENGKRLSIRTREAHSREGSVEEKWDTLATGRKQTTVDVVEVSINIC